MTIDEVGRAAASDVRRKAAAVDTDAMFVQLHRLRRRRTAGRLLGVAVVASAILLAGLAIRHGDRTESHNKPASTGVSTPTGQCADHEIRCLGANRFRYVGAPVPITVILPANFKRSFSLRTDGIEAYRSDIGSTGVSVIENASPAKYGPPAWRRDPAAGHTAASMARWLSHRPFLVHTALTPTTVGGLPAWQVTGRLKAGVELTAPKDGGDVAPTFGRVFSESAGYRPGLTGQYTLVDVRGAGVTAIWSWTVDKGTKVLAANQAFIDGLSFG